MAVSDGMGSGYAACKESEMVIDLIEKFMEAGFLPDTALRMMNSAMVTHGEHNLFSTVDLMRLDLDSGEAAFYKIGAATTFIRHGKEVRMVTQKSMPVGVFVGQQVPKVTGTAGRRRFCHYGNGWRAGASARPGCGRNHLRGDPWN